MSDKARIARRGPADRIAQKVVILGPPTVALIIAAKVGLLSPDGPRGAPIIDDEPGTSAPASPGTLRCVGFSAVRSADGVHLVPLFEGDVPPSSTMTYIVSYNGVASGPTAAPLGEVVAPGRPDRIDASLLPGGDPAAAVACPPWLAS